MNSTQNHKTAYDSYPTGRGKNICVIHMSSPFGTKSPNRSFTKCSTTVDCCRLDLLELLVL